MFFVQLNLKLKTFPQLINQGTLMMLCQIFQVETHFPFYEPNRKCTAHVRKLSECDNKSRFMKTLVLLIMPPCGYQGTRRSLGFFLISHHQISACARSMNIT